MIALLSILVGLPTALLSDVLSGLTAVSGQIAPDGSVNVKAKVGPDLLPNIANTKLEYRTWANGAPLQSSYSPVAPVVDVQNAIATFQIAGNVFTAADQVEYFLETDDASGKSLAQSYHFQLSFAEQRALAQSQAQSKAKDDQITALGTQLSALKSNIVPTNIGPYGDGVITSDTAIFHLTTNTWGKIRVEARRFNNPDVADAIFESPEPAKDHSVRLTSLTPNQKYKLIGYILNTLNGNTFDATHPIPLGDQFPSLTFTTMASTPIPVLNVKDPPEETTNSIQISANADDAYVTVLLEVLSDPLRGLYKRVDSRGSWTIDKYGAFTSDSSVESPYSFTSLTPGTQYRLTIDAVNKYGKEVSQKETRIVTTKPTPPTFAFAGSVELTMGVSGFQAKWTASAKPKSGSFEVDFGDGKPVVSQPATIQDNTLTATLDVSGLQQVIQKAQKTPSPPTLHFTMQNDADGKTQEERFVVSYVVPTTQQVQDAKSKGVINDQQSKSAQNVASGVANPTSNKKFSWSDLISTGLGLVAKLI